jgi:hypothetical protein
MMYQLTLATLNRRSMSVNPAPQQDRVPGRRAR